MERFNGELNVEANLPLKLVFLFMEDNVGTLDIEDRYHLGGCEMLGYSLLLHADEQSVRVHRARGRAVGRPGDRRRQFPHPSGMVVGASSSSGLCGEV